MPCTIAVKTIEGSLLQDAAHVEIVAVEPGEHQISCYSACLRHGSGQSYTSASLDQGHGMDTDG